MKRALQGKYVTISTVGEKVKAFVPSPLPPKPPIEWTTSLRERFEKASMALGRLDSIYALMPNASLFLYMYVRKESVLSSQIEGTQSSLSDLLLFEIERKPGVPLADVQEVSNYVAALNHGIKSLEEGFPISSRLIREIHGVLLAKGRGSDQSPGEFRRSQNWIGGTRPGNAAFVPPPPEHIQDCMSKLELFLHDKPERTPSLLKAALAHAQFETIHPFLDGNGRVGRLLITLLLSSEKVLSKPMLFLSLYFKLHRQHYYELLNNVRLNGDWESWLEFFADAVAQTASEAVDISRKLNELVQSNEAKIGMLGRVATSVHRVHRALLERPIASHPWLTKSTHLSPATINTCLKHLENLKIIDELTGQKRNRLYCYSEYVDLLNKGTEPV